LDHPLVKRLVPVFLFLLLVLGLGCGRREHLPTAQRGVLDLSGYDLDHREPIGLDGEWSFYWRQLLAPGEFSGPRAPAPAGYLLVPGDWNGFRSQGRAIGGLGYATLHLKVLLGPGQVPLALRLFGIHSAYRLWVDGRLAAESGRLGHREDGEAADPSVRIVAITRDGPALDLVLQVSNFHDRNGGLPVSVQFGRQAAVQGAQNRNWALAMLFVGSLLVMGFYHLAIYGFRKANRSPLYFGIYCLLWIGCAMGDEFSDYVIRLFLPGCRRLSSATPACAPSLSRFRLAFNSSGRCSPRNSPYGCCGSPRRSPCPSSSSPWGPGPCCCPGRCRSISRSPSY
jgi:hypothetical protein